MGKTNAFEDVVLGILRKTAVTTATTVEYGLITAYTDLEAGTVTEANYAGYARQAAAFSAPSAGSIASASDAVFPATPGALHVDRIGVWVDGVLYAYNDADLNADFTANEQPKVAAGTGFTHSEA